MNPILKKYLVFLIDAIGKAYLTDFKVDVKENKTHIFVGLMIPKEVDYGEKQMPAERSAVRLKKGSV